MLRRSWKHLRLFKKIGWFWKMMPAATMAADILLGLELAEIPKDRSEQRDGGFTKQGAAVALVTRRAALKK